MANVSGCRCPGTSGGRAQRRRADDDVLWGASLQPYHVHHDLNQDRQGEKCCCPDSGGNTKNGDRPARQDDCETSASARETMTRGLGA